MKAIIAINNQNYVFSLTLGTYITVLLEALDVFLKSKRKSKRRN